MKHLPALSALCVSALLTVAPVAWGQAPTYRVTPLGDVTAYDLSTVGAVTGAIRPELPPECEGEEPNESDICSQPALPAFLNRVGKLHTLNDSGGWGNAVSPNGRVAFRDNETNAWFSWTPSTGARPMAQAVGAQTEILRYINNKQAVGSLETGPLSACAARWRTPTSQPECVIPATNAQLGWAFDGNKHGTLVGQHDGYPFRARPWAEPELFTDQPGQVFIALNDDGTILKWDGTLVLSGGREFKIPTLPGCDGAWREPNPLALDMNASLQVVGVAGCPDGDHAWLWSFSTGTIDLTAASGSERPLRFPHRINDKGQILVEADWTEEEGDSVLLTPLPKPKQVAQR